MWLLSELEFLEFGGSFGIPPDVNTAAHQAIDIQSHQILVTGHLFG